QRTNRLAVHCRQLVPILSSIMRTEDVASLLVLDTPGSDIDVLGIAGVNHNVIENVVIAAAQVRKARPVMTAILRGENRPSTRAQVHVVRVVRIVSEAADIAAVRT